MSRTAATSIKQPRGAIDALLALVCVLVLGAAAWWAFAAPLRGLPSGATASGGAAEETVRVHGAGSAERAQASPAGLDLAAFQAPLWVTPPAPPAPPAAAKAPPEPPPPPPLKWQLLAIVTETGRGPSTAWRALVYDPDTDGLLELVAGQEHTGKAIEHITANSVVVRHGKARHTLSLDPRARADQAGGER